MLPALVSVVVPAFNAAGWIEASLSSVTAQSWPRESLEVVVVDDGSTDETAGVASRMLSSSGLAHAVIRRSTNRGPGAARNEGWRRARGEWIQFLDADDLLAPTKIARQASVAGGLSPEIALIVSPWQAFVDQGGGARRPDGPPVDPRPHGDDLVMSLLRADNFVATGSQLFRRRWLERVGGYDESCRLVEDVHLLVRLAIAGGQMARVPSATPLFWYRRRAGSTSMADRRAFVEARLRNARLVEDYWARSGTLGADRRRFLADVYSSAVRGWTVDHPAGFEQVAGHVLELDPAFVPAEPQGLRRLARLVGYRRAERAAGQYRRLKARVGRVP